MSPTAAQLCVMADVEEVASYRNLLHFGEPPPQDAHVREKGAIFASERTLGALSGGGSSQVEEVRRRLPPPVQIIDIYRFKSTGGGGGG